MSKRRASHPSFPQANVAAGSTRSHAASPPTRVLQHEGNGLPPPLLTRCSAQPVSPGRPLGRDAFEARLLGGI